MSPLIFDIKRTSTEDGPGIRTTVFLKGCNLNCFWCHNPEGKSPYAQVAFFTEKCISCGNCKKSCPTPSGCTACGRCTEYCPTQARKLYGKQYSVEELISIIESDKAYYCASGGGVTFSGGECMLYPEFLLEIAKECKLRNISVAVDTAGNVPFSSFEKVLPYVDLFLYDIKSIDSDLHRKGTGVGNELILENLDRLIHHGANILIRIPSIPGFNEGAAVEKIIMYCKEKKLNFEVLKYHEFGISKLQALNCVLRNETY